MEMIKRKYVANTRNGYWAVDEYIPRFSESGFRCERNVTAGLTKKMANLLANEMNGAISVFCDDNKIQFLLGCQ